MPPLCSGGSQSSDLSFHHVGADLSNQSYVHFNLVQIVMQSCVECHSDRHSYCYETKNCVGDWYFPNRKKPHDDSDILYVQV